MLETPKISSLENLARSLEGLHPVRGQTPPRQPDGAGPFDSVAGALRGTPPALNLDVQGSRLSAVVQRASFVVMYIKTPRGAPVAAR